MAQAQQLQKKATSNGEKFSLQSVLDKGSKSTGEANTFKINHQQFLSKNNITSQNINSANTTKLLLSEVANNLINDLIKNKEIKQIGADQYLWGSQKLNGQELKQMLQANYKPQLTELFKNSKAILEKNLGKTAINIQKRNNLDIIQKKNDELVSIKLQIVDTQKKIAEQTDKLLDNLYKQNKLQSIMRKELNQLDFNKASSIAGLKGLQLQDQRLLQQKQGQILQMRKNNLTIDKNIASANNWVDRQKANFFKQQDDKNADRSQLAQQKDAQDQMNENFKKMAEMANKNTEALANATRTAGQTTADANTAAANKIADATRAAANDIAGAVRAIGASIGDVTNAVSSLGDQMNDLGKSMDDLANKLKQVDPVKIKDALDSLGRCPANYQWVKIQGGYKCTGGTHFITDAEVAARLGI